MSLKDMLPFRGDEYDQKDLYKGRGIDLWKRSLFEPGLSQRSIQYINAYIRAKLHDPSLGYTLTDSTISSLLKLSTSIIVHGFEKVASSPNYSLVEQLEGLKGSDYTLKRYYMIPTDKQDLNDYGYILTRVDRYTSDFLRLHENDRAFILDAYGNMINFGLDGRDGVIQHSYKKLKGFSM